MSYVAASWMNASALSLETVICWVLWPEMKDYQLDCLLQVFLDEVVRLLEFPIGPLQLVLEGAVIVGQAVK